ncbi:TetR/AcrR family transcriptional regulator [Falsiroseomonas tokyonensis]|uniref:TetR/AcrR family transcriptional regulator n=1 Tax=Falsiroseomonas tokyonensis TaxID=430521 RepID=A0ABV7BXE1_9PROT|nr:TetR/AcrR family transcriptional regulator [Falsiroseomonas tokyonensis]MBU8539311.1 TetR/AcrR family transcriptional regulator [Falsiroseomonas tokyonensis]
MSRPRSFDEDAVLDAAMRHFWRHGYAGTSVRDLGQVMGMGQASFYNAFGDKRSLFARCLDRYLDGGMRERIARLEATQPPRQAIESLLREIVARSLRDRLGCLLVNTALEVAPHDRGLGAVVAARLEELEGFFRRRVQAGQAEGSIAAGRDAADLARLLMTLLLGLRVLARGRPDRAVMEGALRQGLSLLDEPPSR